MKMSIAEWAKKHRFSKGEPPQYLKDVMDTLTKGDPVKMVCTLKGQTPGPTCYIVTEEDALTWAKKKLYPEGL